MEDFWFSRISCKLLDDGCDERIQITCKEGEFHVVWVRTGTSSWPQLRMFDDAWGLFPRIQPLLERLAMAHNQDISPDLLEEILLDLGMQDKTKVLGDS